MTRGGNDLMDHMTTPLLDPLDALHAYTVMGLEAISMGIGARVEVALRTAHRPAPVAAHHKEAS